MTNEELEELIISIMQASQDRVDELSEYYGSLLEAEFNKLVSLLTVHDRFWIYTPEGQVALNSIRRRLRDVYSRYEQDARNTLEEALEEVTEIVGHFQNAEGEGYREEEENFSIVIDEALQNFLTVFNSLLSRMEMLLQTLPAQTEPDEAFKELMKLGRQSKSFLRNVLKTQLSTIINNSLFSTYITAGVEKLKWDTRPEATVSGTCNECLAYASGGLNNDGIYLVEDAPTMPAHNHCACVYLPVTP